LIPPILEFLRNWAKDGVAVLIVEQQIDLALSVADRALVLERGEITLEGSARSLKDDARVQEIYLGRA
jgi:branched-chain amino acid transport system ATP-binding protein